MQQTQLPDVAEVGRTAAQLSDWQTITFFLMVIVIALIAERMFYARAIRQERKDMIAERERMWQVADQFTEAARAYSEQTNKLVTALQVTQALDARMEGVVGRLEERVSNMGRDK